MASRQALSQLSTRCPPDAAVSRKAVASSAARRGIISHGLPGVRVKAYPSVADLQARGWRLIMRGGPGPPLRSRRWTGSEILLHRYGPFARTSRRDTLDPVVRAGIEHRVVVVFVRQVGGFQGDRQIAVLVAPGQARVDERELGQPFDEPVQWVGVVDAGKRFVLVIDVDAR